MNGHNNENTHPNPKRERGVLGRSLALPVRMDVANYRTVT